MMIAPNSRARKGEKERREVKKGSMEEFEGMQEQGNAENGGMVQPSQQHVAPSVKEVEWRLGTRCLRLLAAFWVRIPLKVTQMAGVVPRCIRAAIGTQNK